MKIHEYQAKALFAATGIPVAAGRPAFSVEEAVEAAEQIGGSCWAVKAQIHAGAAARRVASNSLVPWMKCELLRLTFSGKCW